MRNANAFSHQSVIPRMSWSPKNLYNLLARSTVPSHVQYTDFTKTSMTIYQQRWRSKRLLRGYHGDWIQESRFKRWFLPSNLPKFKSDLMTQGSWSAGRSSSGLDHSQNSQLDQDGNEIKLPIASLFVRDVERRLDTAVFRACFVRSAYEARRVVVHGKVSINGVKQTNPNTLLSPGDLISVEPSAIPMLSQELANRSNKKKALLEKAREISKARNKAHSGPQMESEDVKVGEKEEGRDVKAEEGKDAKAEDSKVESSSSKDEENKESTSTETDPASSTEEAKIESQTSKESTNSKDNSSTSSSSLPEGVLPFNLPPFATPFLFIPPFLEVSFRTCSFIYLRHPTILSLASSSSSKSKILTNQETISDPSSSSSSRRPAFRTDLPSPYDPASELFSLASEHYSRNSPRIRGDLRRERDEARHGRNGFTSARIRDSWKRKRAVRKGWARNLAPMAPGVRR